MKSKKREFEIRLERFSEGVFQKQYYHIIAKNKTEARKLFRKPKGWTIFTIRDTTRKNFD